MSEKHTNASSEEAILGVTRDAIMRPAGILMVVVGVMWALFVGMAAEAGTYGQPLAAAALIFLGIVVAGIGKPAEQI